MIVPERHRRPCRELRDGIRTGSACIGPRIPTYAHDADGHAGHAPGARRHRGLGGGHRVARPRRHRLGGVRARKDVPVVDPFQDPVRHDGFGAVRAAARPHGIRGGALRARGTNPEECEAFFSRLCDFKIEQIKRLKEHYDVDMVRFQDDWGTQTDLMFQPEIWRTLIRPHVKRVVDAAHELGVLFDQHSCGKIDRIVGEVIDMGIDVLDPVQPVNDLPHWIDEYKDKVVFMGALDAQERHRPSRRHRRRDHGGGRRQDRPVRQRGRALHPLCRVRSPPT